MLPDVEYETVLSGPPSDRIPCLGIVESISEGRRDLPFSDSDWATIVIDNDGA